MARRRASLVAFSLLLIGLALPTGCVSTRRARAAAELVEAHILVPANCMTGQLWDVEPLSREEMQRFLMQRLPGSHDVGAEEGQIEVFEKHCGKRVVWIPESARPTRRDVPCTYREHLEWAAGVPSGRRVPGPTVGDYLCGMLPSLSPRCDVTEEKPDMLTPTPNVYIALVTQRNLLIVLVPRDLTRPSLPGEP